jgi:hypothetical protein
MASLDKIGNIKISQLKKDSSRLKNGMGVVSWAVLEMFRRAGMPTDEIEQLKKKMNTYFTRPTNDECNAILKVVEDRLQEDKEQVTSLWYF